MLIRCWGSRGSVSVSGKHYIKYGGDTTCVEVESASGDLIILDAGTGIRELGNRIIKEKKKRTIHLLLTHAHWDHLAGFPFFKPIYNKDSVITVYGPQPTQESLKHILSKAMTAPYFPVELDDIHADITYLGMGNKNYTVGSVNITTVPLNHPNLGVGYSLEEDGVKFVFLTDNELTLRHSTGAEYEDYMRFCEGATLLFHDAEYTRREYKTTKGWGHSVYLDALKLAMDAGVKTFGLFHHNQDRHDEDLDKIEKHCKDIVRAKGSRLRCFAVPSRIEIYLPGHRGFVKKK